MMPSGTPPLFLQGLSVQARFYIFLALSIFLILIDSRLRVLDNFRSTVSMLIAPMAQLTDVPILAIEKSKTYFVSKATLGLENHRLQEENQRLSLQNAQIKALEQENNELRTLVHALPRSSNQVITAEVLGQVSDPFTKRIRINRGQKDGILVGMPVIGSTGVIGQISRVVQNSAEITLLTDHTQKLSVFNVRTKRNLILSGTGAHTTQLQFIEPDQDIQVGDILRTTGLDHIFPAQIYAGRISAIQYTPGDTYQVVEVEAPSFDHLNFVSILLVNPHPTAELEQHFQDSRRETVR